MEPLVSIMIPAHKPTRFARTLASALDQDWPNLEILISDDSGGTEIAAIVEPHQSDPRLSYSRHPQPSGIVGNYRRLLELAHGEWGLYLDDDDLLYDGAITTLAQSATHQPGIVLVYAGYDLVDLLSAEDRRLVPGRKLQIRDGTEFFRQFTAWPPVTISVLFDVAAARAARIFSDLPNIKSGDWEAWLRIALHGQVAAHPAVTGCHFRHEGSYSAIPSLTMDLHNALFIDRAADYAETKRVMGIHELRRWHRKARSWYLTWTFSEYIARRSFGSVAHGFTTVLRDDWRQAMRLIGNPALCGGLALSASPGVYTNVRRLYRRLRFGRQGAPNF